MCGLIVKSRVGLNVRPPTIANWGEFVEALSQYRAIFGSDVSEKEVTRVVKSALSLEGDYIWTKFKWGGWAVLGPKYKIIEPELEVEARIILPHEAGRIGELIPKLSDITESFGGRKLHEDYADVCLLDTNHELSPLMNMGIIRRTNGLQVTDRSYVIDSGQLYLKD